MMDKTNTNLMTSQDGVELFVVMTRFTSVSSMQLSIMAFDEIIRFDPSKFEFNISKINVQLNQWFTLATTSTRILGQNERIQHTIVAYMRIRQPEEWARWAQQQGDLFDEGMLQSSVVTVPPTPIICQDFMNRAQMKYTRIIQKQSGEFKGSLSTIQEEIVAMMSAVTKKNTTSIPRSGRNSDRKNGSSDEVNKGNPPFIKHFKSSTGTDAKEYKVGDEKQWGGKTWYFCDCPKHRDKMKWHTFPVDQCRTRKRWLEEKKNNNEATGAIADGEGTINTDKSSMSDLTGDLTVMLAGALNHQQVQNDSVMQDLIRDVITLANENKE